MTRKESSTSVLIFRILLISYIFAVAYLCFGNFQNIPSSFQNKIFGIRMDKIVHFCMFFPFPILGFFSIEQNGRNARSRWEKLGSSMTLLSLGCIFAGLTEIIQGMMPYRSEDIMDFAADCLAITISSIIVHIADLKRK